MLDAALKRAQQQRAQAEADFKELLAIPSVSSLNRHREDCRRAADWTVDRLKAMGMDVELADVVAEGHPVISAEWLGRPGRPTLAIYGHYDVQPPDPLDEWETPPFEPTVRDGRIYARGAGDNKGQYLSGLKAAEYAFAEGGPPVNLRFLIEGEEEITGPSLPTFVTKNAGRLKTDYLFIADGSFFTQRLPSIVTALRGILYTEIEAVGAEADLHSGIYGGIAPNPLNTLAHIIAALKGRDGRITIPGFYDDVRPPGREELDSWKKLPKSDDEFMGEMGVHAMEGELEYSAVERTSWRPTLDVHGIIGGFVEEGKKTVIPARAKAKVSMRLVPDQDPARILDSLRSYAKDLTTPGVRVEVHDLGQAKPVLLGTDNTVARASAKAFEAAFGEVPAFIREGGSIPVTVEFQEALRPEMVVTGFGAPDMRAHSPNESHPLENYHRGTEMVLRLMDELGRGD
jgi:acetylornithine deacetylase/succinyl-diaminopimelate desuccinylase-like protein